MVLGLVTVSVFFYVRKRPQTLPVSPTEENDTPLPHEMAYEQLAAIEASDWLKRGDMETYHIQIAYVLREYIRGRYQIPALELTTTALLHAMQHAPMLSGSSNYSPIVIGSSSQATDPNRQRRLADARWIVDETKITTP